MPRMPYKRECLTHISVNQLQQLELRVFLLWLDEMLKLCRNRFSDVSVDYLDQSQWCFNLCEIQFHKFPEVSGYLRIQWRPLALHIQFNVGKNGNGTCGKRCLSQDSYYCHFCLRNTNTFKQFPLKNCTVLESFSFGGFDNISGH